MFPANFMTPHARNSLVFVFLTIVLGMNDGTEVM